MKIKPAFTFSVVLLCFLIVSCQSIDPQFVENQDEMDITTALTEVSVETSGMIGRQTVNGVTITIDWAITDARRVSFGYTIEGLPVVPDAVDLFGTIQLVEKSGTGELGWGGHSSVNRVEGSPGTVVGTWSSVFAKPFTQPNGQFRLDIELGDDSDEYNINYAMASFPVPSSATPYPPNVFPPKLPERKVGDFHFDFETEVYPLLEFFPSQSVTANGIEMRLELLEITATFTSTVLCYQKPSVKDWMTARSTLRATGHEVMNNTYTLLFDADYDEYKDGSLIPEAVLQLESGRCVQIEFLHGHTNTPGVVTLTIPALEQSIPEVIPDEEIAAAREKLLPQGIDIDWEVAAYPGGGGASGPVYNKLPAGMTEHEAYQAFIEALGYIHPGPWEFTLNITP